MFGFVRECHNYAFQHTTFVFWELKLTPFPCHEQNSLWYIINDLLETEVYTILVDGDFRVSVEVRFHEDKMEQVQDTREQNGYWPVHSSSNQDFLFALP